MKNKSTRLSDQIADQIKKLIQVNHLQVGDRLPSERDLSEQLQVSRSPVREAIRMLNSQGLLVTKRGGGTYVQLTSAQWSNKTIAPLAGLLHQDLEYRYDVLEARQALEKKTAALAALRATEKDKENIQRCFDVLIKYQRLGDNEMSARADAQFHLAIAEASHNVVLIQVMRGLFELVLSTVTENRHTMFQYNDAETTQQLTTQHASLMDAILNNNPEQAEKMIDQHLLYVQNSLRSYQEDQARLERAQRLSTSQSLL